MKKRFFALSLICTSLLLSAADVWVLPQPEKEGGKPVMSCMTLRKTTRVFADKTLTDQQLSNILYAACGINRPNGKLTIATAVNCQDIVVYAATSKGIYRYDRKVNALIPVVKGNYLEKLGRNKRMHGSAPLCLLYVTDFSSYHINAPYETKLIYACSHAGAAQQDVALYCASAGLGNVIIGSLEYKTCSELLKLGSDQRLLLGQLVGIPR